MRAGRRSSSQAILHIGLSKTGSSAIQASLAASAPDLKRRGIGMPPFDKGGAHNKLRRAFTGEPRRSPRLQRKLARSLRRQECAIISGELFFRLPETSVAELAEFFARQGYDAVQVVAYVRAPGSRFLSLAQENLKKGRLPPDPDQLTDDPTPQLQVWQQYFPVVVRPYDRAQLAGGSVASDFAAQAETFFQRPVPLSTPTWASANSSLSAEAMICLHDYLRRYPAGPGKPPARLRRLTAALRAGEASVAATAPRLSAATAAEIAHAEAQALHNLEQAFGVAVPHTASPAETAAAPGPVAASDNIRRHLASYDEALVAELAWAAMHATLTGESG